MNVQRRGRRADAARTPIQQLPWTQPRHTLARYATAFYQPLISDWRNFQTWEAAGAPTADKKANALWKQALAEYREPWLDPVALERIDAFVARRSAEGGEKADL